MFLGLLLLNDGLRPKLTLPKPVDKMGSLCLHITDALVIMEKHNDKTLLMVEQHA